MQQKAALQGLITSVNGDQQTVSNCPMIGYETWGQRATARSLRG